MTSTSADPASPCVRICVLDAAGTRCVGCGRTIDEIAAWSGLSLDARLAILSELDDRLRAMETA